MYTKNEVIDYVREEDVKFIRLAFTDVHGNPKNISVMPGELPRAFSEGISFDASAIEGFGGEVKSDLVLVPDPATLSPLPWRPSHGRVVRMFCDIRRPDGTYFEGCSRVLLRNAVAEAKKEGLSFGFGAEMEFYLFETDEEGKATDVPFDRAGYMDMAPDDRGENVRREICLTLDEMGIIPESSHHEEGPGQNEIDFRYSDPLSCADNVVTVKTVVKTVAAKNGLFADFSPKPLSAAPGSGMHVNMSVQSASSDDASACRRNTPCGDTCAYTRDHAFPQPEGVFLRQARKDEGSEVCNIFLREPLTACADPGGKERRRAYRASFARCACRSVSCVRAPDLRGA